ncbi:unnamed protein product [Clonostachys chloroleuca]|uniref:Rhodopsin domain-containing protein n=1 Tax=Clonostachys chloroleuca TaxID=1926264 RepID=A0AA35LVK9_9HYPO|nr:unnamed protein product [Clonostachys chloroleuca]
MNASQLAMPAAKPPPGMMPNFVNPPNHNAASVALIIVCLTLATFFYMIRIYSKVIIPRKLTVEDGIATIAFGCFIGMIWAGLSLWKTIGFFVDQYNVRLSQLFDTLYIMYLYPLFYGLTMMGFKTAILLEWIHIFVPKRTKSFFWWTCWVMIVLNTLFYIGCIIAIQFYCTPIEKNWHRWIPGVCRDRRTLDTLPTIFNLAFDILILVMPQRVIWKLKMDLRRKIGVSIIFSMGLMACVCAASRIAYTWRVDYTGNVTRDIGPVYFWSLAESTCAVMVFCVPALPKAFSDSAAFKFMKSTWSSWVSSRNRTSKKGLNSSGLSKDSRLHNPTSSMQSLKNYQKMPDTEVAIPLDDVHYGNYGHPSPPGIVRTTELRTDVSQPRRHNGHGEWTQNSQPWSDPAPPHPHGRAY